MQVKQIRITLYHLPLDQILVLGDAVVRDFVLVNILPRPVVLRFLRIYNAPREGILCLRQLKTRFFSFIIRRRLMSA